MKGTRGYFYRTMLDRQRRENQLAAHSRASAFSAWNHVADRVEQHFRLAKKAMLDGGWFEEAYVARSPQQPHIQLFLGQHLVGTGTQENLEGGAAAVVSQGPSGEIIFLLYPYGSNIHRRRKAYLVWHLTEHPMSIKDGLIGKFVRDFLVYARVSSALFAETTGDRRKIDSLEKRSRVIEGYGRPFPGNAARKVLAVASVGLAGLFGIWISTDNGKLEPIIGLVTLAAGWLATALREHDESLRIAKVEEEAKRAMAEANDGRAQQRALPM